METQSAPKRGNMNSAKFAYFADRGSRTQDQYDTVKKLHSKYPSAWWLGDPFKPRDNGKTYRCSFIHAFYDEKGRYVWVCINPDGAITDFDRDDSPSGGVCEEVKAIIETHGVFRG